MMVSTRGRYALRILVDLAQHAGEGFVSLAEVAERQGISLKYLEAIAADLGRARLLESKRGKAGGYRLSVPAEEIRVGTVLNRMEKRLLSVGCLGGEGGCGRAPVCPTEPLWRGLETVIGEYLQRVTVADLTGGTRQLRSAQ